MSSHPTKERLRKRTANGVVLAGILALTTALVPREGRAAAGFFETMGISIAVGTVLGASTLPFYDQPSDHMSNVYAGAAIGAGVGLGILIYGLVKGGPSDEEKFHFDRAKEFESGFLPRAKARRFASSSPGRFQWNRVATTSMTVPAAITLPLVSLNW